MLALSTYNQAADSLGLHAASAAIEPRGIFPRIVLAAGCVSCLAFELAWCMVDDIYRVDVLTFFESREKVAQPTSFTKCPRPKGAFL